MCAIIGWINSADNNSGSEFTEFRDRMIHRGPDDAGFWCGDDGRVLLGQRRLAILDLSPAGHQPMTSSCGRYVIVYNGEIYNYLELRNELEAIGCKFIGSSDTEVLLAAYGHWGEDCLRRLNGMFAFAVWDRGGGNNRASLFLARDRAGKKPLYYAHVGCCFVFSSELKSIPHRLRGDIDLQGLNHYLALGYIPGSLSLVEGVRKLPAAHAAKFFPDTGSWSTWRWWCPPPFTDGNLGAVEVLVDEAEFLLRDAVRIRMRSDVPVGVLLSGGLDSSLVVGCAARCSDRPIKTFTMGLPGSKLDETAYAGLVAKHFSTDHHVLEIPRPSLDVLTEFAPFVDEPLADSSLIPSFLISRLTARHVTVALGGDGGDELFGGYSDYTSAFADQARFGWVPAWLWRWLAAAAGRLPPGVRGRNRLAALRGGPFQSLVWGSPFFDAAARRRILSRDAVASLGTDFFAPEMHRLALFQTGIDPLDSMTRTHFGSILPDDFLVKVDRASMAVSLEMRCPLLDVRLVEFAFGRLPSVWKVQGGDGRRLQKLLGRRLLPPALDINRKQGFSIPMNEWLRSPGSSWEECLHEVLPDVINPHAVQDLVTGHARDRTNGSRIFALLMLNIAVRNLSVAAK
jgi:asparagine synthase (glutamine-hydrolysing)